MFDFESFCDRLPRQSREIMVEEIESKIEELKGRTGVSRKKGRFSPENFSQQYGSDIKKLDKLAEFISGDFFALENLSEIDRASFESVREKTLA